MERRIDTSTDDNSILNEVYEIIVRVGWGYFSLSMTVFGLVSLWWINDGVIHNFTLIIEICLIEVRGMLSWLASPDCFIMWRDKPGSERADAVIRFKVFPCQSWHTKLPDLAWRWQYQTGPCCGTQCQKSGAVIFTLQNTWLWAEQHLRYCCSLAWPRYCANLQDI